MADPVKFKISATVAAFVRPGVTVDHKLAGLGNAASLAPVDRVTLVYFLTRDAEAAVKQSAGVALSELPENVILNYIDSGQTHPAILDALTKLHHTNPWIVRALLGNENLSAPARTYLQGLTTTPTSLPVETVPPGEETHDEEQSREPDDSGVLEDGPSDAVEPNGDEEPDGLSDDDEDADADADGKFTEIDEADEQFQSKYKIAMVLGISEKIKMALTGDKEWRSILIKDANKLVSGSVIKNPRITDGEILSILKVGVQNDEIVRLICANKEWTKNYLIRKALIECPKTPLPNSLRYLTTLNEKDIASYAKSKNISSVISTQAKRLLLAKKR